MGGFVLRTSAKVKEEVIIPAKGKLGRLIKKGQMLQVIDLEGKQVMDLVCFSLERPSEKFWVANTAKLNNTPYLTTGHVLYSDYANKMLTIVEDTVGVHDMACGSCCAEIDLVRYGVKDHFGCMENLTEVLREFGIPRRDIPMSFNIFMNAPIEENGSFSIKEPVSKPGDYIVLKAEMDLIVGMSNCPQDLNPCNGWNPTPLKIAIFE
jgi:urea carboxylase-associated protein 1